MQVNGKDFGDVVADKLTTYGDQWKGINLADGQDGLYNKDKAKAQLEKAKAELQKDGVQFPIHIDVPVAQSSKGFVARMQSLKQTVEDTLGKDNVVLDLQMMDQDEVLNITLNVPSAADADWDTFKDWLDGTQTMMIHQLTSIHFNHLQKTKQKYTLVLQVVWTTLLLKQLA